MIYDLKIKIKLFINFYSILSLIYLFFNNNKEEFLL